MNKMMIRIPLQVLNYTVFMAIVWYFSIKPPYHQLEPGEAMVTFTLSHVGQHVTECVKMSYEELMKLPPNMRKPMDCPRERSPVTMQMQLDDKIIYSHVAQPLGLYKDQGIDVYENIKVPAGEHHIKVWINDDVKVEGPIYSKEQTLELKPEQHLVVQFDSIKDGFSFK